MSHKAKAEYLREIRPRYKSASKLEKENILDEFCEVCRYNRKYAIRLLNKEENPQEDQKKKPKKLGRPRCYHNAVIEHFLKVLLRSTNMICSKRLKEIIPIWLPFYEEQYSVKLNELNKKKILNISPATIDRILSKARKKYSKHGLATTKPGKLLKKHVPIKTNQWDETRPGFIEADTVAHCDNSVAGMFVYTVNTVDIATGWTEARAIWGKGEKSCLEAIKSIEESLPFKIKGFDSDNGSEFLNWHLMKYFTGRSTPVEYTRSRAYQKNDNAHIEGKNWTHIRQYLGYGRFDKKEIVDMLNEIYLNYWSDFFNFFIASSKLQSKGRKGSKVLKVHDKPKTPYQRLIESKDISSKTKSKLKARFKELNPFELQNIIHNKITEILNTISR
jgi:hypothetical protein